MAEVRFTEEADRGLSLLAREDLEEFFELAGWLERNPNRLPPWVDVVKLPRSHGKRRFRIRWRSNRAVYTWDGATICFIRISDRKHIEYDRLPKV